EEMARMRSFCARMLPLGWSAFVHSDRLFHLYEENAGTMFKQPEKLYTQLGHCFNRLFRSGGIRSCLRARGAQSIMPRQVQDRKASERVITAVIDPFPSELVLLKPV
ncbi:hypothetical protein JI435_301780, partial [Parastagonospora nodorum SN15]